MVEHQWEVEEVDGGPVGSASFWTCPGCGAGGGPVDHYVFLDKDGAAASFFSGPKVATCEVKERHPTPSYPGYTGTGHLDLPDDCDDSKELIADFKRRPEYQAGRLESYRSYGRALIQVMTRYGVDVKVNNDGVLRGGIKQKDSLVFLTDTFFRATPEDTGTNDKGWLLELPDVNNKHGSEERHPSNYSALLDELHEFYGSHPRVVLRHGVIFPPIF